MEKVVETKQCKKCQASFTITDRDIEFYETLSPTFAGKKYLIPYPTFCPNCRQQRRLSLRNERSLYHRKCDLSGKNIVSMYSPNKPYKVYDQNVWRGDERDATDYAQDFDFSRPFFEQFNELMIKVPRISLINTKQENSEFCNFSGWNKNSYLAFTSAKNEELFYTNRTWTSVYCIDCSNLADCNNCYEVIDSENCKNCFFSQNCADCYQCYFCLNTVGCNNCIGCYNLVNKSYCIENKQYSKEEYETLTKDIMDNLEEFGKKFETIKLKAIRKYMDGVNTVDCSGNAVANSKKTNYAYEVKNLDDCKYIANATCLKKSIDVNNEDNSELVYEAVGSETNYRHLFNDICRFDKNIIYNSLCFYSSDLFGCVGLKHKQYCILNKQYTKEEYEALVPQIIEHMRAPSSAGKKNGEWGEFFPSSISPFGYNETINIEHFPLSKEEAIAQGFNRSDYEAPFPQVEKILKADELPDITDVTDEILKQAIVCEVSKKPFKVIKPELEFYRKHNLPLPHKHPDVRHMERMALRNPRKLWDRKCNKCEADIKTSYSPKRPEIVYCEACYNKEVY